MIKQTLLVIFAMIASHLSYELIPLTFHTKILIDLLLIWKMCGGKIRGGKLCVNLTDKIKKETIDRNW
jgi:hypothetical protein